MSHQGDDSGLAAFLHDIAQEPKKWYEARLVVFEHDSEPSGFDEEPVRADVPPVDAFPVGLAVTLGWLTVAVTAVLTEAYLTGYLGLAALSLVWGAFLYARRSQALPEASQGNPEPVAGVRAVARAETVGRGLVLLSPDVADKWRGLCTSAASIEERGERL